MGKIYNHIGKDGTFYDTWDEKRKADIKWEQQERQNQLLEEQNEIIKEQQEEQMLLIEEQNRLIEERNEEQKRHNEEIERQNSSLKQSNEYRHSEKNSNDSRKVIEDLKIQQFNMEQKNVPEYINRAFMYLEDEEYTKANKFFDMVLDIDPQKAQAHLGKFLCNQNASSLEKLQNSVIFDLEDSKDFMRALKYSENEDKIILQDFLESNKLKIEKIENEKKENLKKVQELCKNFENNYKNTQKENFKIAEKLFFQVYEKLQSNEIIKQELETQIKELNRKFDSLGLFKAKEKENIQNEIQNKKSKILEINSNSENLKEEYRFEIKKLCEQEEYIVKKFEKEINDPIFKEHFNLLLNHLGISIDFEEDEYEAYMKSKLNEAIEEVLNNGNTSTSSLQRTLKIGYGQAERITDQLESLGIISSFQGNKPREVIMSKEKWLEINGAKEYGRFYDLIKKLNQPIEKINLDNQNVKNNINEKI